MKRRFSIAIVLALMLIGFQLSASISVYAQTLPKPATAEKGPDGLPKNIDSLTPQQIDELIAKTNDADVRRALLARLKEISRRKAEEAKRNASPFAAAEKKLAVLRVKIAELFDGVVAAPDVAWRAIKGMAPRDVPFFQGLLILLGVFAAFLAGLLAEWLFRRWTAGFRKNLANPPATDGKAARVGRALTLFATDIAGIAILFAVTYGLFLTVFAQNPVARLIVGAYALAYILIRIVKAVATLFLAPRSPALRLRDISDSAAIFLHRWVIILGGILSVGYLTNLLLLRFGLKDAPHISNTALVGLVTAIAVIVMIWQARARIRAAETEDSVKSRGFIKGVLVRVWPVVASIYVVFVWMNWSYSLIINGRIYHGVGLSALLLPVLALWLDRYFASLFDQYEARKKAEAEAAVEREIMFGPTGEVIGETVRPPKTTAVALVRVYRRLTRGVLALVTLWLLFGLFGIDLFSSLENSIGAKFASVVSDVILTGLVFYLIWEVVRISIDSRLQTSEPGAEGTEHAEGEGAGAARSRSATLLPLLKKFLGITLLVVAVMVVLSRLGVNIAPLIAGAGVIGVAIGFGAQTLIRDIVAGIFFLADDAFRLGEYVESGNLRGTVEKISVRSMRLRHHRGMIHTIPYGEMRSITNYSRDWVIMKLEFRLPFGTDIEKVRKLIKKVGQDLQENPDFGKFMLAPLKSQGVARMDESGLVFRAKFSATPGEQFVIRREAFRMIQETLYANGIQFSNYQVAVQLPEDVTLSKEDQELVNKAAAAAAAGSIVAQKKKQSKGDAG